MDSNDQAQNHRVGGRKLIGMVGGISSESRAGIPRNGGRHQFGIRSTSAGLPTGYTTRTGLRWGARRSLLGSSSTPGWTCPPCQKDRPESRRLDGFRRYRELSGGHPAGLVSAPPESHRNDGRHGPVMAGQLGRTFGAGTCAPSNSTGSRGLSRRTSAASFTRDSIRPLAFVPT